MSSRFQRITPFLWFDHQAEEAATFYVSVFPNSRVVKETRYTAESAQASGRPEGSIMTIDIELDGQRLTAINGGPIFKFTEALSLVIHCQSQAEVDHYWHELTRGADERAQQCGWLKDRYGVSWQVVPDRLIELLTDPSKAKPVTEAMMQMKKIDIAALEKAAA
ncbi:MULTISPECIES: VOC family protein [Dyella]|uniref:VOC family protein n=2 Tax=Dyella TaxID=231454 RepID=A0A4R0Z0J3_9GAMM|nr:MULTISPECIES: VOC family protein [Dyella]TBR39774.1 VOC family protein [Dyella terrae]TCI12646.1 VOC family protein [Dyella soli]